MRVEETVPYLIALAERAQYLPASYLAAAGAMWGDAARKNESERGPALDQWAAFVSDWADRWTGVWGGARPMPEPVKGGAQPAVMVPGDWPFASVIAAVLQAAPNTGEWLPRVVGDFGRQAITFGRPEAFAAVLGVFAVQLKQVWDIQLPPIPFAPNFPGTGKRPCRVCDEDDD